MMIARPELSTRENLLPYLEDHNVISRIPFPFALRTRPDNLRIVEGRWQSDQFRSIVTSQHCGDKIIFRHHILLTGTTPPEGSFVVCGQRIFSSERDDKLKDAVGAAPLYKDLYSRWRADVVSALGVDPLLDWAVMVQHLLPERPISLAELPGQRAIFIPFLERNPN